MTGDNFGSISVPQRPGTARLGYSSLKTAQLPQASTDLFTMTITASKKGESTMDDQQLLIDLVFKPLTPGLKLRPGESQLLFAYIGEILKELEAKEQLGDG